MVRARSGFAAIASCLTAVSLSVVPASFPALASGQKALKNDELPVGGLNDLDGSDRSSETGANADDQKLAKKELKKHEKEEKEKQKQLEKAEKEKKKYEAKAQQSKAVAAPTASSAPAKGSQPAGASTPTASSPAKVGRGSTKAGLPPSENAVAPINKVTGNLAGETAPVFQPDTALISVLKDLARTLKDPDDAAKIKDANQGAVAALAQQILEKALEKPIITSDRIVRKPDWNAGAITTEAWASGEVKLADGSRGSLSAVWAKHENGLLNLSIAGESPETAPNGRAVGQFVVIVNGRSSIEKGFDIQSQTDVKFWICKLANVAVESDCCNEKSAKEAKVDNSTISGANNEATKESEPPVLESVVTERSREYLAKLQSFQPNQIAPKPEQEGSAREGTSVIRATQKAEQEMTKPAETDAPAKAAIDDLPLRAMIATPTASTPSQSNLGAALQTVPALAIANMDAGATNDNNNMGMLELRGPASIGAQPAPSSTGTEQSTAFGGASTAAPRAQENVNAAAASAQETAPARWPEAANAASAAKETASTVPASSTKPASTVPVAQEAASATPPSSPATASTTSSSSPEPTSTTSPTSPAPASASSPSSPATTSTATPSSPAPPSATSPGSPTTASTTPPSSPTTASTTPPSSPATASTTPPSSPATPSATSPSSPEPTTTTSPSSPEPIGTTPASETSPQKPVSVASLSTKLQPANSSTGWESPAQPENTRQPGLSATIVVPERAIAGQFLTASVINSDGTAEPLVELSFNGAPSPTDKKGQVWYMVPEDATPGRSLSIALAQRPELAPAVVDVFQPLTVQSQQEVPNVDTVTPIVGANRLAVIEGHNFDGYGDHDRILIDGATEAKVLAASPVQLKVQLPDKIQPGVRTLAVEAAGMRSNSLTFQLATAQVFPDAHEAKKDRLTKLFVKVLGTSAPVQLHITNQTPQVIRLSKGDDVRLTTPGGEHNSVDIAVQRLRPGSYRVTARVE